MNNTVMRPAMVIMDTGDEDIIVARITSQKRNTENEVEINRWKSKGLLMASYVRLSKIATLNRRDIRKKISRMDEEDIIKAKMILKKLMNID